MNLFTRAAALAQRANKVDKAIEAELEKHWKGRIVILRKGKYAGRECSVEGLSHQWGEILFCCYVIRKDGTGFLNSDNESRTGWRAEDFYFTKRFYERS